ncbi:MAG: MerR family transcriptional regulator [Clostridia bacterium]|nr:MerR family transcriptional regulator [Clostridia bacterium]
MFKIGEFSHLSKTTIKTLRYYDSIDLFKPSKVEDNGYRYYTVFDLNKIALIKKLRNMGLSIESIKSFLTQNDTISILEKHLDILKEQENQIKKNISFTLDMINIIKKGDFDMENYKIEEKVLPQIKVFIGKGIIKNYDSMGELIMSLGKECGQFNPDLKCSDYCFVTYTAQGYQEKDIEIEYYQEVNKIGIESQNIRFDTLNEVKAICLKHYGEYNKIGEAYAFIMAYMKEKNLKIKDKIREVYIHGCWDTENEKDYLTEIQIPIF